MHIGDAIIAIFGTPIENPHHALDAYFAGFEMRKKLVDANKKFVQLGKKRLTQSVQSAIIISLNNYSMNIYSTKYQKARRNDDKP